MMGWQWHRLGNMQIVCTSLQTDNHASTSPLSFCRPDAVSAANQQRQGITKGNTNELGRTENKRSRKTYSSQKSQYSLAS